MQLDWTTFVLEIVNFLVLVWVLKRFLYRPVMKVLAERRAMINRTLAQATDTQTRAAALESQFRNRLADWEQEKSRQRAQFEDELAAERVHQMQALEKSLAAERERNAAQETHRLEQSRHQLETKALEQARQFTATLMSRLAGPGLEAQLIDAFIDDWSHWPEDRFEGLLSAATADGGGARVVSAYRLPDEQRSRIATALATRVGQISIAFSEDSSLVAGLKISIGAWQIQMTIADELANFAASTNRAD